MSKFQSRREFLRNAGLSALAASSLMAFPGLAGAEQEAPAHPFEYKPVDPALVEAKGRETFKQLGCCAGAFAAIVGVMADTYGYPYNVIPVEMFANGGGGYTAGSLCGTLGGSAAAFGLFCPPADARALSKELFKWYTSTPLPTFDTGMNGAQSISATVNCADSLAGWMAASGLANGSDEQRARCGALTAEVACKAVELLNIHFGYAEAPVVEEPAPVAAAANEYIGTGISEIGGEVKVKVTMDGSRIANVEVISHSETAGISTPAIEQIPQKIVDAQSADVDVVANATKTSEAIIAAVKDALAQVK